VARAGQGEPAQRAQGTDGTQAGNGEGAPVDGAEGVQVDAGAAASLPSDALSAALPLRTERYPRTLTFASPDDDPIQLEWRFLGIVPVGVLRVEPVPEVAVLPGGQAIGVLMNGDGL